MKEQLEKELLNSLETVKEYISKTAEFASEQAPLVVEELVRFNLWYSGGLIALAVFVILVWLWGLLAVSRDWVKDDDAKGAIVVVGFAFLFTPSMIVIIKNVKTLIMCLTAPRLFVIEYLRGMM